MLVEMVRGQAGGIEAYHRAYGDSAALRCGLLRMWAEFEDSVTNCLARENGGVATPMIRLHAIQLVGIVRTTTSPELRAAVDPGTTAGLEEWLHAAARAVDGDR
jgi:hypothetical protein